MDDNRDWIPDEVMHFNLFARGIGVGHHTPRHRFLDRITENVIVLTFCWVYMFLLRYTHWIVVYSKRTVDAVSPVEPGWASREKERMRANELKHHIHKMVNMFE